MSKTLFKQMYDAFAAGESHRKKASEDVMERRIKAQLSKALIDAYQAIDAAEEAKMNLIASFDYSVDTVISYNNRIKKAKEEIQGIKDHYKELFNEDMKDFVAE